MVTGLEVSHSIKQENRPLAVDHCSKIRNKYHRLRKWTKILPVFAGGTEAVPELGRGWTRSAATWTWIWTNYNYLVVDCWELRTYQVLNMWIRLIFNFAKIGHTRSWTCGTGGVAVYAGGWSCHLGYEEVRKEVKMGIRRSRRQNNDNDALS